MKIIVSCEQSWFVEIVFHSSPNPQTAEVNLVNIWKT